MGWRRQTTRQKILQIVQIKTIAQMGPSGKHHGAGEAIGSNNVQVASHNKIRVARQWDIVSLDGDLKWRQCALQPSLAMQIDFAACADRRSSNRSSQRPQVDALV